MTASGTSVMMMLMVMASRMWRCLWLLGLCWAGGFCLRLGADSFKMVLLGLWDGHPWRCPALSHAGLCPLAHQPLQRGPPCPLSHRTTAGSSPTRTSRTQTPTPLGTPATTAPTCPTTTSGTQTATARGTLVTTTSMGTVSGCGGCPALLHPRLRASTQRCPCRDSQHAG